MMPAEVADVQGVGRGVSAEVCRDHLALEEFLRSGHNLGEHTAPFQFFNKVLCHCVYLFFDFLFIFFLSLCVSLTVPGHIRFLPTGGI